MSCAAPLMSCISFASRVLLKFEYRSNCRKHLHICLGNLPYNILCRRHYILPSIFKKVFSDISFSLQQKLVNDTTS